MRLVKTLLLTAGLLIAVSACSPASQQPVSWNYYDNEPGGIQVRGEATGPDDFLYAETDAEACQNLGFDAFPPGFCESVTGGSGSSRNPTPDAECQSGSAFEIFPPGWSTPGSPWIRRCR